MKISSEWLENFWRNSEDLGDLPGPIGRPMKPIPTADTLEGALRAMLGQPCRCGHTKDEHAAGSGECMAILPTRRMPIDTQDYLVGDRPVVMAACPCSSFAPAAASPAPAPASRGCLARALGALSFASELARAAGGYAASAVERWRAARTSRL